MSEDMLVRYLVPLDELNENYSPQVKKGGNIYWETHQELVGPVSIGDSIEFSYRDSRRYQGYRDRAYKVDSMTSTMHIKNNTLDHETMVIILRRYELGEPD